MSTATHEGVLFVFSGRPKSGKSTTRGYAARYMEVRGGSCSDILFAIYASRLGISVAEARALPKEVIRPDLVKLGNEICAADPAYLVRSLYDQGCRVIDGVRRKAEWEAVRAEFDVIGAWVENPNAPAIKDNTELTAEDFEHSIQNTGTLSELASAVAKYADRHKARWLTVADAA